MKLPLTKKQEKVLNKLISFITDKGYSPTIREFQKLIKVNSVSNAWDYLARLEKSGWIIRGSKPRSIKINK